MYNNKINIIILAAGLGTRMHSDCPKLLHLIGGKPILQHVIDLAKQITKKKITIIYNSQYSYFKKIISDPYINWILQKKTLGTGDAVHQGILNLNDNEDALILYGDTPLVSYKSIQKLILAKKESSLSLLTAKVQYPKDYGRIVRNNNKIMKIVEHKHANKNQLKIKEINSGIFIASIKTLKQWIKKINFKTLQKEFYITDIVYIAYKKNYIINSTMPSDNNEVIGINNLLQLSYAEKYFQKKQTKYLLSSGVMITDPSNFTLKGQLKHGKNIKISAGVILEGKVIIGDSTIIETGCIISNSDIGNNCIIKPYSIINETKISNFCNIGPFSNVQQGTIVNNNCTIGNFVEIKNSTLGEKTKIKHLSYLGNSKVGNQVNIGAGTITCNYDGKNKLNTIIEDNVFVGSHTQLIAPITISKGTLIAAGTTVMKNVTKPSLVYNKKKQINKTLTKTIIKKTKL